MEKHVKRGLCFRPAMLTVAFLLMSLISFSASAYDFEIDGVGYNIKSAAGRSVTVASLYNVPEGKDCVIPEKVVWKNTPYSVVAIARGAFIECKAKTLSIPATVADIVIDNPSARNLTSIQVDEQNQSYCSVDGVLFNKDVTKILMYPAGRPDAAYSLPSTVTSVGNYAFQYSENLREIILPPGVEKIGYCSFAYCTLLKSMDYPDSVTFIDSFAMEYCDRLRSVSIGKSLSDSGRWNLFYRCKSLKEINVDAENKNFCSIDGVLYRILGDEELELISYPIGRDEESYSFSDRVTSIGEYALSDCKTLPANMVLPNSVKVIKAFAFMNTSLKSITLPASLTEIRGNGSNFDGSAGFSEIIVDKDNRVFASKDGVLYEKDMKTLLVCPFAYPTVEFNIPDGVVHIESFAFNECDKIEKINIPESVKSIGVRAFRECSTLKSIIIPNSVSLITESMLEYCSDLQSVTIGSSVQQIESYAFNYCNLSTIICLPTVPPEATGYDHFDTEACETATLYVPKGCKVAYSTAKTWRNFRNIVEMGSVGISDINAADGEVSIRVENGAIVISGAVDGATVEVYAADGRCVYRGTGTEIAGLAHGLYIVRAGSAVSKVVL